MTHAYHITNMTCSSCEQTVKDKLLRIPAIEGVSIDLPSGIANITMSKHVPTSVLQETLKESPRYQLSEAKVKHASVDTAEEATSWVVTYMPILLVFGFITGVTLLIQLKHSSFDLIHWMDQFMAGFFLVFSFFKMLDINSFAENYGSYDIISRKWYSWGYVYPFVELALGIAFLTGFEPILTNLVTFIVMSLSIVGVLKSVLKKRKIRCACLGAVFNLPMSTITIIEDGLMIFMSLTMLITLL